ncbi:MAG: ATP-binding cassette domain-containing protein, partial [Lachnospiraceae bacterium]|nr:ATP-binding cassette domain-containing protein [Lachnospiraceae bacterium]
MLKMTDIKKTYPGFMLNCSLEVVPGRITGLIGENGAGKTTLFKTALGLRRPDSGSISLFGKPVNTLSDADRQQIGAVFAEGGFSEYLKVGDVRKILRRIYTTFDEPKFDALCQSFALPKDKM